MAGGWIDRVQDPGVVVAARSVGWEVSEGTRPKLRPCPLCGAVRRSRKDRRWPVNVCHGGQAFKCWACDGGGSAARIVAAALGYDWSAAREHCVTHGWLSDDDDRRRQRPLRRLRRSLPKTPPPVEPEALPRPPSAAVQSFWESCSPIVQLRSGGPEPSPRCARWLTSRGIDPAGVALLDVARIAPPTWPGAEWWPRRWARSHPLILPAFEPDGRLGSLHGRAVAPLQPKTLWPKGYSAGGLLFADDIGLSVLRGEAVGELAGLLIVEGATDHLAASVAAHRESLSLGLLGAGSGGFRALGAVSWPHGARIYMAPDGDAPGDDYADLIAAALGCRLAWRLPIPPGADLADLLAKGAELGALLKAGQVWTVRRATKK